MEKFAARYNTHPTHTFPWLAIQHGHVSLAQQLRAFIQNAASSALISIDGFAGLEWSSFIGALQTALAPLCPDLCWLSTEVCLLSTDQIDAKLETYLTDDPVFGRLFYGHLEELWDPETTQALRQQVEDHQGPTIVYGIGASLIAPHAFQVYVDVPKDRGQDLARQQQVWNVGAQSVTSFGLLYKRLYFVDWPMLGRVKRAVLPKLAIFVDGTESTKPFWTDGEAFRKALSALARQPFRLKPWFAPGPWGGQWMKEHFALSPEQPNYAWSFEMIAPENGILLGDGQYTLECSFDYLLWQETDTVLGPSVAARYGCYFPLRFDYLDTMGGTNLSCQVHPRVDYIRSEFGEPFTQDETYYIMTCKPGARVFLGLLEDTNLEHFRADAYAARDHAVSFDITNHVNSLESHPHDLFLIPSGTVHCSGTNNLVLEISATPYIYTFKIYDYLRSDLNGKLRHVHLEHAFANIENTRRTDWVQKHLLPQPVVLREDTTWREVCIGNSELLFFAIHRLEFTETIVDSTAGRFLALNLVEGEQCEILTRTTEPIILNYAESIILPASIGSYALRNTGNCACKVIKAFVKP